MTTMSIERQVTYDVGSDFRIPELATVSARVDHIRERDQVRLRSRYFDTADLDLLQAQVTLRQRIGSVDAGWQLKLPSGETRTEIGLADEQSPEVPEILRSLVVELSKGKPLIAVVDLHIVRDIQQVIGTDRTVMATVSDDTVEATPSSGVPPLDHWREVEVELGPDQDEALLGAIGSQIERFGATRSNAWSKLVRALARLDITPTPTVTTAGEVVIAYLSAQRVALLHAGLALRGGAHSTHDLRVAGRRIRSTLRVFEDLFADSRVQQVDGELRWLIGELGRARDSEVTARRVTSAVADLPPHLVFGGPSYFVKKLEQIRERDAAAVLSTLSGTRYAALLDNLDAFLSAPRMAPAAARKPARLLKNIGHAQRQFERRLRKVNNLDRSADHSVGELHRLRKSAKRARYAVELGVHVMDSREYTSSVRRLRGYHDRLGDVRDSALAAAALYRAATEAIGPMETGFTLGVLYEQERRRGTKVDF